MVAIILSCVAIVVAIVAAGFAGVQAMAVTSDDHRKREPRFEISMRSAASNQQTTAIYKLKMVTDQPVDEVSIPRPEVHVPDGRIFPLSVTGQAIPKNGIVIFGPLKIGDSERLSLEVGGNFSLPDFELVITSSYKRGRWFRREYWTGIYALPDPRVEPDAN
jgi:hypothetical protein